MEFLRLIYVIFQKSFVESFIIIYITQIYSHKFYDLCYFYVLCFLYFDTKFNITYIIGRKILFGKSHLAMPLFPSVCFSIGECGSTLGSILFLFCSFEFRFGSCIATFFSYGIVFQISFPLLDCYIRFLYFSIHAPIGMLFPATE